MPEQTTTQTTTPAAKPAAPTTKPAGNEVLSSIYSSAFKMNKFSSIGSFAGFVAGLIYANQNDKHGFWTYVGHGIIGSSIGLAAGSLTDKLTQKK